MASDDPDSAHGSAGFRCATEWGRLMALGWVLLSLALGGFAWFGKAFGCYMEANDSDVCGSELSMALPFIVAAVIALFPLLLALRPSRQHLQRRALAGEGGGERGDLTPPA